MNEQSRRLDSWKEIADYLGRDVRTVMRWAKTHGLPVRRVGGERGRSVFAFPHEIDTWLAGHPNPSEPAPLPAPPPSAVAIPEPAAPSRSRFPRRLVIAAAVGGIALLAAGLAARWRWSAPEPISPPRLEVTPEAVLLSDGHGLSRAIHTFGTDRPPQMTATAPKFHDADADGIDDVLIGVTQYVDDANRQPRNGELINVSAGGDIRWRFEFDDVVTFRDETFDGPWGITDWSVEAASSPSRIAVAGHHHTWWPSLVAVLDHTGRRLATFVHPGWAEFVLWLDERRLAVSGFNNARDAAMLAVIDPAQPRTRAPQDADTPFSCGSCEGRDPLLYATFGRSELNLASGARFNRARVRRANNLILVQTVEVEGDPLSATAIYEFDADLRLLRARYDDVYWDAHRRLEREGKLTHARDACPERDGPTSVHVWRSGTGWVRILPSAANNSVARLQYR